MDISRTEEEFFSNVIDEYTNNKSEDFAGDYEGAGEYGHSASTPVPRAANPYSKEKFMEYLNKPAVWDGTLPYRNAEGTWKGAGDSARMADSFEAYKNDPEVMRFVDRNQGAKDLHGGWVLNMNRYNRELAAADEIAKNKYANAPTPETTTTTVTPELINEKTEQLKQNLADKKAAEDQAKQQYGYLAGDNKTTTPEYNRDDLAKRVLSGEFGNGTDRINALTKAGYNSDQIKEVQGAVNAQVAANEQRNRWDAFQKGNMTSEQLLARNPNMSYEDYFKATGNSRERFDKAMAANAAASQNAVASAGNSNAVANIDNPNTNNGSNAATSAPTEPQTQPAQADNSTANTNTATAAQTAEPWKFNIDTYERGNNKKLDAALDTMSKNGYSNDQINDLVNRTVQSQMDANLTRGANQGINYKDARGNLRWGENDIANQNKTINKYDISGKGYTDNQMVQDLSMLNPDYNKWYNDRQAAIKAKESQMASYNPGRSTSAAGTSVTTPVTSTNTNPTTTNGTNTGSGNSNSGSSNSTSTSTSSTNTGSGNSNSGSSNSTSTSTSSNRGSGRSTYVTHSIAGKYIISTNFGEGR